MNLQTKNKLLKIKTILNKIKDCSYRYNQLLEASKINTRIDSISEEDAQEVIAMLEDIILDCKVEITNYTPAHGTTAN